MFIEFWDNGQIQRICQHWFLVFVIFSHWWWTCSFLLHVMERHTPRIADKSLLLIWSCHLSVHWILLCFGYHVSDRIWPSYAIAESLSWAPHDLWAYDQTRIIHCPKFLTSVHVVMKMLPKSKRECAMSILNVFPWAPVAKTVCH